MKEQKPYYILLWLEWFDMNTLITKDIVEYLRDYIVARSLSVFALTSA